jgi:hypothetical protein
VTRYQHEDALAASGEPLWLVGDKTVFSSGCGRESTFGDERRFNAYGKVV